ncbi:MAG: DUF6600 domain-containing protein [Steroidobacteraceae bacterium]
MMLPRTLLVLALAASSLAWGEPLEAPERIARLAYVEGQVAFRAAQEVATSALPDRPLIPGDRLATDGGGRAELTFGTATVRLDERTELSIATLDATTARVELNHGTASVHLRELYDDETFVVATPNTTLTLREPGEYRIAVPADSTTDLTVRGGSAEALTAGGPVRIADGQRVRLEGRQALASLATPRAADAFDDWVLEREVQLADLAPSTEQLATGYEYEELDRYGEWYDEPSYGRVWMPSYAYGGYDPFRYGHWQQFGMGRTWVNSMPWGFHTFNSGRWAYLNHLDRWCWVPTRRIHHDRDRVAQDTAPIGRPRGDRRGNDRDNDSTPIVSPRTDDDRREPVATTPMIPRRIDADRAPVLRRDAELAKPTPRVAPAPRVNRDRAPAERSAASATQSDTGTMRPSRPAEARREAQSSPPTATNRELGTLRSP